MRTLLFSAVGILLNLALDITVAKYGPLVPDIVIIGLWLLPLIPLTYWLFTHPKLLRSWEWLRERYGAHRISTLVAAGFVLIIIGISLTGVAYEVRAKLVKRPVATVGAYQSTPVITTPTPTIRTTTAEPIKNPATKTPKKNSAISQTPPAQPPLVQINSAPNGIAIGGGNVGTATVINNGPPPLPTPNVRVCTTFDADKNQTTIMLKSDVQIYRPWFAFFFDGPVLEGSAELNDGRGAWGYNHGRADKLPFPERSFTFRLNTINFGSAMWFPSSGAIKITIPSDAPVHLIKVLGGAGDDPDALFTENILFDCH